VNKPAKGKPASPGAPKGGRSSPVPAARYLPEKQASVVSKDPCDAPRKLAPSPRKLVSSETSLRRHETSLCRVGVSLSRAEQASVVTR